MFRYCIIIFVSAFLLVGCATSHYGSGHSPTQGNFKVGSAYQVSGKWYTPTESYSYDETGISSWYGDEFNGKRTANGEIFDKNALTAAHPTLQLPSLIRVTNLENGRSAVLRVNDRGPFAKSRLIDVSHKAANVLGYDGNGTARVRVQVLERESRIIADAARKGYTPAQQMAMAYEQPVQVAGAEQKTIEVANAQTGLPEPITQVENNAVQSTEIAPLPPQNVTKADIDDLNKQLQRKYPVEPTALYIQVGAFTDVNNANALKQKLSSIGHTQIFQTTVNGRLFNRVRIGPVQSTDKADAMLKRTLAAGYPGARIVVD
jgi:rare lipoprotein A